MFVVVIHHPGEVTPDHVQALSAALGVTAFDARQRLAGQGLAVVTSQADRPQAEAIKRQLRDNGFTALIVDVETALNKRPVFIVHSFAFEDDFVRIHDLEERTATIPFKDIKLILPASRTLLQNEFHTVTERKLSIARSVMMGGLPMTKKVTRQETVSRDEREQILYLCSGNHARIVCSQDTMSYEGFANEMKPSRGMNFNQFIAKVRQNCPEAGFDERLLKRSEQVRLLGPLLAPERYIDLAVDILVTIFVNTATT